MTADKLLDSRLFDLDSRSVESMLREWRFAPIGAFQTGDPYTERFQARLTALKAADPAAFTAASKAIGWS